MLNGSNTDSLTGLRLGSCILEAPLGAGGMGTVYVAQQERPHRRVAVKVLRRQPATDADAWRTFLARFRREADATAALDHANIVPIFEFGEEGDVAYLVMPYLADGSVAALLDRQGTLPLARVVEYIEQAAAALDYAHTHGVVHRDVKPSNLLLHPDGRLLLADFGIARMLDHGDLDGGPEVLAENSALTQSGSAMGTPEYMSPEQVRGERAGPAADIYALGIVACVMLLGRNPFAGGDVDAVLTRQLVSPPLPLRIERPEIPARVEASIFYALAKEPADRPATAGDFARALRAATRGRSLGAMLGWSLPEQIAVRSAKLLEQSQATALVSTRRSTGRAPLPPAARARPSQSPPLAGTLDAGPPGAGAAASLAMESASAASMLQADATEPRPVGLSELLPTDATFTSRPLLQSAPLAVSAVAVSGVEWHRATGAHRLSGRSAPEWRSPGAQIIQSQRGISTWQWVALVSAIVAVLLGSFVVASALSTGNLLSGRGLGPLPGTHSTGSHASTPTITPMPTATRTPLPPPISLTVSSSSVSLGCKTKSRHTITLTNAGSLAVPWSAQVADSSGTSNTGISLSPREGTLESHHSVTITITNTSFFMDHQGTITFAPSTSTAGKPAVISYSTTACAV